MLYSPKIDRRGTTGRERIGFVGRQHELALIIDRLHTGAAGEGRVVLVAGEPGIGKSRLAEEITGHARELGMRCCWGRATDAEGNPPYWPFRQVLRALVHRDTEDLAPVLGGSIEPGSEQRFRLFEAVTEALVAAAEPSGLLIVLDDVHWADPASLQLFLHLTRGTACARLAVVATYRDTETGGHEPMRAVLSELAREPSVTRVRLTGLSESEVGALVAGVTGWQLPVSATAALVRRTQGNPFFVGELARMLTGDSDAGGNLPDGVRDAVRARLDRLSPRCRQVVSAAAVLGSAVVPSALAAAMSWDVADVLGALDEAAAAGIVTDLRFGHDLIRETARLDVPTVERLGLHMRMAEHLMSRVDAAEHVTEVALHWLESLPVGDAAQAAAWAERAAARATAQLAWEEAAALYGRAVAVARDAGLGEQDRCRLLLAMAQAQVKAYDMEGARRSLLAAAEIGRITGSAETIAEAALIMEGVTDFVWDATTTELSEEALAGLPEQDSALRARLLAQLAVIDSWHSFDAAQPRSAAALEMAEQVGDRHAIAEALRARQIACSSPDGARDRLAIAHRMLAGGRGADVLWGHLWRFDALAQLGDIDMAEAELDAIRAGAKQLGSPLVRWHSLRCEAAIALARGRLDEAVELGELAVSVSRRGGHGGGLVPSAGFLMIVRALKGEAEPLLDEAIAAASTVTATAPLRGLIARLLLAAGRRAEARRMYRTLPPSASVPGFMLFPTLAETAELAAEFEDKTQAAEVYELLAPYADLFVCGGAGVIAVYGSARLPLGVAAATVGRLDDSVRHLRAAAEINERAGMPPFAAIARCELAAVLARRRRPGDREEAAALAASAGAEARKLGMVPLQQRCDELAATLSGQVASPLTRREREIALLVSQGLTSRQIAAVAHISERTAENHVQHILGKLGFTSRAQIAAWVASAGVGDQEIPPL